MTQITSGIHSLLSSPIIYDISQSIMGAHRLRTNFVTEFIKPFDGCTILDIGCGTADILSYLPTVAYTGFDISSEYIERARSRFGQRGKFIDKELTFNDVENMPKVDIVLGLGLLHHLDNDVAVSVLLMAKQALKPGGRFLSFDPCFDAKQNPIARMLIRMDRGQNVRTRHGYEKIANTVFEQSAVHVRHRAWIPYTHCFMECTKK